MNTLMVWLIGLVTFPGVVHVPTTQALQDLPKFATLNAEHDEYIKPPAIPLKAANGSQIVCGLHQITQILPTGSEGWVFKDEDMDVIGCDLGPNGEVAVIAADNILVVLSSTGQVLWKHGHNGSNGFTSVSVGDRGIVYVILEGPGAGPDLPIARVVAFKEKDEKLDELGYLPAGSLLYKDGSGRVFAMGPISKGQREIFRVSPK